MLIADRCYAAKLGRLTTVNHPRFASRLNLNLNRNFTLPLVCDRLIPIDHVEPMSVPRSILACIRIASTPHVRRTVAVIGSWVLLAVRAPDGI